MGNDKEAGNQKKTKTGFFHSMGMKIILLTVCAAFIATVICELVFMNFTKTLSKEHIQNNMLDLAEAYNHIINTELEKGSMDYSDYASLLSNVKLDGVEGSYSYLVDASGIMLYHPTREKVGQPVENTIVSSLVAQLKSGTVPQNDFVTYEYKGAIKYASYTLQSDNSILVVTADESSVFSFYSQVTKLTGIINIFNLVFFSLIGFLFSLFITKPLKTMTELIEDTSEFNFKKSTKHNKIKKRKDEIGAVGNALSRMRGNLRSIVGDINQASDTLAHNIDQVASASDEIDNMCTDTSSTTQELAAGMEETAAAAETINESIHGMQKEADDIRQLTKHGDHMSVSIMERANHLNEVTISSNDRANTLYANVKERTNNAIEDSKAVSKINELTEAIMSISTQTSLLALNANIEAARAGEAGRGFAVVATEIGALANQSSETVSNINQIVGEVTDTVSKMADTLTDSLNFLETVVLKDYEQFMEVSVQYREDASSFQSSMVEIEQSINTLTDAIDNVATSLSGISSTVSESTIGVTDIAAKTSDIANKTSENGDNVHNCLASIDRLREIAKTFQIE